MTGSALKRLPWATTRKRAHGAGPQRPGPPEEPGREKPCEEKGGGVMSKRYGRPSAQYRYEHYDPRW